MIIPHPAINFVQSFFNMKHWYVALLISYSVSSPAQSVLFNFDSAPIYTSLPIDQTEGGITAHLSAPLAGYSIQQANVLGFTPPGFDGHIIYPNSIYLTDLCIGFDQAISRFSIMYCCQELGCDDAATMRVTAYLNGSYVGTNTRTAANPGTWPVDSLKCNFPQGFDSVVIHYDSPPPTCQDYGVIFLADNMSVTALTATSVNNLFVSDNVTVVSSPYSQSIEISVTLAHPNITDISLIDISGSAITTISPAQFNAGTHEIIVDLSGLDLQGGIYFLRISGKNFLETCRLVILK